MRILFAGTPDIAVPILEALSGRFEVCAVLTTADSQSGRGRKLEASPVKTRAHELGIPVLEARKIDEGIISQVRALAPDIIVVAAFGKLFKKPFIDLFPMGGINFHPSLLPRHRGASPIPAAILEGDMETGVTIHRLALGMDSGDILEQWRMPLTGTETTATLGAELAAQGARMIVPVLERLESGTITATPQDEAQATYCRFVKKEHGIIDWGESAEIVERKIRAFDPWPRTSTSWEGKTLLVLKSHVYPGTLGVPEQSVHETAAPGQVLGSHKEHGLLVKTGRGILAVERLQLQFKKPLDWRAFVNGHSGVIGARFGG